MTDTEFKNLEILLQKLGIHLGHTYCIIPGVIQDGFNIAIYDKYGEHLRNESAPTIKDVCEKLKN